MAVLTSFTFRVVPKMYLIRTPRNREPNCSATFELMSRRVTRAPFEPTSASVGEALERDRRRTDSDELVAF